jgi:AI-2E family transporter
MPDKSDARAPVELDKLVELAYVVLVLGSFIWAKDFLLPIALAILISLLLAPVVSRLERWRFPSVLAVLSVVAIAFAIIAGLCTTFSVPSRALRTERLTRLKELKPQQIVLSAVQSGSIKTIDRMIRSVQHLSPSSVTSVCLWSLPKEGAARWIRRIKECSHAVYTGMEDAVSGITVTKDTGAGQEIKASVSMRKPSALTGNSHSSSSSSWGGGSS